jgi:hypothetical protein
MEKKKLDKNIEANLFSGNTPTVITALTTLKDKGNSGYLPFAVRFAEFKSGS